MANNKWVEVEARSIDDAIKAGLNELNLEVVGGFIFDHLNKSKDHSRIKSKIISTCAFLNKLNAKVFVIIDHISEKRMQTSGKN